MDHGLLFYMVQQFVSDIVVLRLIWGYLKRTVCLGENYREVERGICLDCPHFTLVKILDLIGR